MQVRCGTDIPGDYQMNIPLPKTSVQTSKCDASRYEVPSVDDAKRIFSDRSIYIWGAGQKGRGFLQALKRNGFNVEAFLDSSDLLIGTEFEGVEIIHPDSVLKDPLVKQSAYILMASIDSKNKEMFRLCEEQGLKRLDDFNNIQYFSPFYPTIEVTGVCNLQCSSCPRSDKENPMENGRYMSAEDYERIINKMVREIPFLYLVDLYIWGEPILNKELPRIIEISNRIGVACGISTNLNNIRYLKSVVEAQPAQIRVSLSGASESTYDLTHTGGSWRKLSKNFQILGELIAENNHKILVEVYYHIYKHNTHELKIIKELCDQHNFRFLPSLGILFQDLVLEYRKNGKVPKSAELANELLYVDLDTLIEDCIEQDHMNCLLTRCVPVINWDMSVMPCCTYSYSKIYDNYLDVPLGEIISTRTTSDQCLECQQYSLHRWNNQVFYQKYIKTEIDSLNKTSDTGC